MTGSRGSHHYHIKLDGFSGLGRRIVMRGSDFEVRSRELELTIGLMDTRKHPIRTSTGVLALVLRSQLTEALARLKCQPVDFLCLGTTIALVSDCTTYMYRVSRRRLNAPRHHAHTVSHTDGGYQNLGLLYPMRTRSRAAAAAAAARKSRTRRGIGGARTRSQTAAAAAAAAAKGVGAELIGRCISVVWPLNDERYHGWVLDYSSSKNRHLILEVVISQPSGPT